MENMKEMYMFWLGNIAKKSNGEAYRSFMIYVNALDNETYGINEYNIYSISDPKEFCNVRDEIKKKPNYNDIDKKISHNALSASLNKYEEFLGYLKKNGEEFQKKYEENKNSTQSKSTPASKPAKKSEKRSNYAKDAKSRYKNWLMTKRGLGDGTAAGYASALNRIG